MSNFDQRDLKSSLDFCDFNYGYFLCTGMPSIQNLCKWKLLDYTINYVKSRKLHECDGKLFNYLAMG